MACGEIMVETEKHLRSFELRLDALSEALNWDDHIIIVMVDKILEKKVDVSNLIKLVGRLQLNKGLPLEYMDKELYGIDVGPLTFSFAELKTATNDFDPSNKLGKRGFGPVYKGTLNDGRVIAVKQLSTASHQ